MVQYTRMKSVVTALCVLVAFAPVLAARVDVPSLPPTPFADTETATNIALNVNAARLEKLTLSVTFDTCETNEVLVAIGADTDGNGDLSFDESALLYGCDCGAWYRADLCTGAAGSADANGLVMDKNQFDPAWNLVKVVRRGLGEIGESVSMDVLPSNLGGVFSWQPLGCACSISGSGSTFAFNCSQSCTCCGSSAEGTYAYEGYFLFTSTCPCGCYYDGTGPVWTETPVTPPYTNSVSASVSATFTEPAVIFENAYENRPGDWVPRCSTRTRLNIVADGGLNGAVLTVSSTNLVKLSHLSGPGLPLASVSVPAETSVSYSIVYEGLAESLAQDDIAVTATVTENLTSTVSSNTCTATSIRLELAAIYEAPENPCTNRHVYGVGEKVRFLHYPESAQVSFSADTGDTGYFFQYYDRFNANINESDRHRIYVCPIAASYVPNPTISFAGVSYMPLISIVEPETVITPEVSWMGCHAFGDVGQSTLVTTNYIGPMTVSFQGVMVAEIPCYETNAPSGYFATTNFTGFLTHSSAAGAGMSRRIQAHNRWTVDYAGGGLYRNWSAGQLVWNVPIGWIRLQSDSPKFGSVDSVEYELFGNSSSRPLLIGGKSDVYTQTFKVDDDGTARIDKFEHWLSRSRHCHIKLDGDTKQLTHLW